MVGLDGMFGTAHAQGDGSRWHHYKITDAGHLWTA